MFYSAGSTNGALATVVGPLCLTVEAMRCAPRAQPTAPTIVKAERTWGASTVHSFSDERKPFADVPIGTVTMVWVHPDASETFVLLSMKPHTLW